MTCFLGGKGEESLRGGRRLGAALPDYRDFDRLNCLTQVVGEFENITPLRVGAGREVSLESTVDIGVFRVGGVPCVPGSSLKGVMRSLAEAFQRSKNPEAVHDPWEKEKVEKEVKEGFCPICGIFGNTELASHVKIYDSYPLTKENLIFVKPGVAISREWGSVRTGPFHEEFVRPGVRWNFRMDAVNILVGPDVSEERGKLLYSILQTFKVYGLQVGARKTLGAGLIVLRKAEGTIFTLEKGEFKRMGGWTL